MSNSKNKISDINELKPTKKLQRSQKLKEGSLFFKFVVWILSNVIVSKVWRRDVGVDKIPQSGAAIIIAPHLNELDSMIAPQMVTRAGRMPRIFAKASLWKIPPVAAAFNSGKLIPVERGTANAAKSLEIAKDALKHGDTVFIFPEGTCSKEKNSWPMSTKTGAARLAIMSGAPVIPILQDGAQFLSKNANKDVPWAKNHIMKINGKDSIVVNTQVYDPIDFSDLFTTPIDNPSTELIEKVNIRILKTLTQIVAQNRGVKCPNSYYSLQTKEYIAFPKGK